MKDIVLQVHKSLIKYKKTIATAESCTGGLLAKLLTDTPGSSSYFILGIVTYSNKTKESVLGIPHSLIIRKGAVSEETASLMAENVRKIAHADFGIGITGIAGPTGGTKEKPVGTVFISLASTYKRNCKRYRFAGTRKEIRQRAALKALRMLQYIL